MKHARTLMLINTAVVFALGVGFAVFPQAMLELLPFFPPPPRHTGPIALLRMLGALFSGLGLILWFLLPVKLNHPRQVLLMFINAALCIPWIFLPILSRMDRPGLFSDVILFGCLGLVALGFFFSLTSDTARPPHLAAVDESAAQQERSRLARDLHDSIKQQLFSIKLSSAAAEERWESDPGGARAALTDVRKSSQEAMVEMQALLTQLRPEPLATVGLVEALREQCEALGYRCGIPVHFEIGDLPPDDRLPATTQENLFRVAQEALSNVAHHARARSVHVQLGQVEQEGDPALLLQVRDDGQGFDPAGRPTGMGLRNMRERLEAMHGTLDVESAPGQGTAIRARMSLTPPETPREILKQGAGAIVGVLWLAAITRGPAMIFPLLALFFAGSLRATTSQAAAKAGRDSAQGVGLRLVGHQQSFILLALAFWWNCTLVPSPPFHADPPFVYLETFLYRLEQVLRFIAPLALVLALREAWSYLRLRRSVPRSEPVLHPWLFATMLLVFLVSLPCLFLLPDPWDVARFCIASYAILYVAWWLRNLP